MNKIERTLLRIALIGVALPLILVLTTVAATVSFKPSSPAGAQESSVPTYHSNISEVRVVFFATDQNNHPIEAMQADDFVVVDDGNVIRDFRTFTRAGVTDLDIIVLMDFSDSILPHLQREINGILQVISSWPWRAGDRLSVLSFNGTETRLVCSGNCHTGLSQGELASLPRGGATPLFDALAMAADLIIQHKQPDAWPVIILFSDGADTISKVSLLTVGEKLLMSGAQVYSVELGTRGQPSSGREVLQRLAEDSGGRFVPIGEGAVTIVNDMIDDLHSARMVTYDPPLSASDFHSIRILPSHNRGWKFRSRRGYYRPGNAP